MQYAYIIRCFDAFFYLDFSHLFVLAFLIFVPFLYFALSKSVRLPFSFLSVRSGHSVRTRECVGVLVAKQLSKNEVRSFYRNSIYNYTIVNLKHAKCYFKSFFC